MGENCGGEAFVFGLAGGAFRWVGQAWRSGDEDEGGPAAGVGEGVAQSEAAAERIAKEDRRSFGFGVWRFELKTGSEAGFIAEAGGPVMQDYIQILNTSGGVAVVTRSPRCGGVGRVAGEVRGMPSQFREGLGERGKVRAAAGKAVEGDGRGHR